MDKMLLSNLKDRAETAALSERSRKINLSQEFAFRITPQRSEVLIACALLLILALGLFHRALLFVPENGDDLRLLSSVAHTAQPLKCLVGDWGAAPYETGNYGEYRPLHPISLWIVYKMFGVRAFPNQFINLALHFTNAVLLLILILRIQKDLILGFMGASLFLISVHTMSSAIWVSDRASLQVGLALLLLMHHLAHVRETGGKIQNWYVLLLCLLALLSKESGLIVPLLAIVASMQFAGPTMWVRIRSAGIWVMVIGLYFLGRLLMFGSNATSYSTFGYLFGLRWYYQVTDLPAHLQKLVLLDNVAKNVVEAFLPIFSNEGGIKLHSAGMALGVGISVLAMASLLTLTMKGKLCPLQIDCLWIILLNAGIHNAIFRYRILYTAQIAICLFVACGPSLHDVRRRTAAVAAACLLLIVSTVRVDNYVQSEYLVRYNDLNHYKLERVMQSFTGRSIDPKLAKEIVEKYRDWSY
jgi:hypothetical protein